MAERRQLIKGPPKGATGSLPPGKKNRPLGEDTFSDIADVLMGAIGLNDPLDPDDVSTATSIGALGSLGAGLKGLFPKGKLPQPVQIDPETLRELQASLPAEFQATKAQEAAFNALRTPPPAPEADVFDSLRGRNAWQFGEDVMLGSDGSGQRRIKDIAGAPKTAPKGPSNPGDSILRNHQIGGKDRPMSPTKRRKPSGK
jgi:hypothetical protein